MTYHIIMKFAKIRRQNYFFSNIRYFESFKFTQASVNVSFKLPNAEIYFVQNIMDVILCQMQQISQFIKDKCLHITF